MNAFSNTKNLTSFSSFTSYTRERTSGEALQAEHAFFKDFVCIYSSSPDTTPLQNGKAWNMVLNRKKLPNTTSRL